MISGAALNKVQSKANKFRSIAGNIGISGWANKGDGEVLESGGEETTEPAKKKAEKDAVIANMASYINSPLYKKRLQGMKVKNPDELIQQRLKKLNSLNIKIGAFPSELIDNYSDNPTVNINSDYAKMNSVKAHEIGHAVGGGGSANKVDNFGAAEVSQISPRESWRFYNHNKYVNKPFWNSPDQDTTIKQEMWNHMRNWDVQKAFKQVKDKTIPIETFSGIPDPGRNVVRDGEHTFSSSENYADLQGVRQLLFENKFTKAFGDDINMDIINKAIQSGKFKNDIVFKRMLENFSPESIVELNNTIAKGGGQKAQTMA
jgi:hypothetical protein